MSDIRCQISDSRLSSVLCYLSSVLVGSNGLEPSTSRLSGVRSNHLSYEPISVAGRFHRPNLFAAATFRLAAGGDEQNRTVDPLLARQVLSQLSYAPMSDCRSQTSDVRSLPLWFGAVLGESTLLSASRALKIKQRRLTKNSQTLLPFDLDVLSILWMLGSP